MISDGTKQVYLGTFDSAEEAALEYNKKSIELFGHTSNLNQVDSNGRPIPFEVDEEKETHERKRKPRNKSLRAAPVDQFVLSPVRIEFRRKHKRKEEIEHQEPVAENPPVAERPEEHHEQDAVPVEINSSDRNYNG
jgi:hypothetical protein